MNNFNDKSAITKKVFSIARMQKMIFWTYLILLYMSFILGLSQGNLYFPTIGLVLHVLFTYATIRSASLLECSKGFIFILLISPIITITLYVSQLMGSMFYSLKILELLNEYNEMDNILHAINFLQIIYLYFKAMRTLSEYGVRTGFFGTKKEDLLEFARANR